MPQPSYTQVLPQAAEPIFDLTVITVCRNVLPQLMRTTASVIGQKAVFPNVRIEHVIVDGASTDGTPEWLATMKAHGMIETYVSEPDCGIYDAMNKGINLARGQILLFLNADDTFAHVDLEPCLTPILSGQTKMTAARNYHLHNNKISVWSPLPHALYEVPPCCHQAFFAATSLYRELGGYRARLFRCIADHDFMCRAITREGVPTIIDSAFTVMPLGGFSQNCFSTFCDEYIALLYLNKEALLERCQKQEEYADAIVALLIKHCMTLRKWQLRYPRDISEQLDELQELCLKLKDIVTSRKAKAAMQFAASSYLPTIKLQKQCTLLQWLRIRRYCKRCALPKSNPYVNVIPSTKFSILASLMFHYNRLKQLARASSTAR